MKATTPAAYLKSLLEPRRGPTRKLHDLIRATIPDLAESYKPKLPKADIGKSCIRFRHLEDLDPSVLRTLLRQARAASKRAAGRQARTR